MDMETKQTSPVSPATPPVKAPLFTPKRLLVLLAALVIIVVGLFMFRDRFLPGGTSPDGNTTPLVTWVDRNLDPDVKAEFEVRISTLEAAMQSDSTLANDIGEMLQLANLKYAYGDLAGAKEWYEKILATHPNDAPAHENLAQTLLEMGDYAGAETHWRAALTTNPYEVTYIKLADLIRDHFPERQAEIQTLLEDAIATLGQTPGLLVRLGQWYEANGDYESALSHYHVAKQLSPDDTSIDILIDEAEAARRAASKIK